MKKWVILLGVVGVMLCLLASNIPQETMASNVKINEEKALKLYIHLKRAEFSPSVGEPYIPIGLRAPTDNNLFIVQFVGPPLEDDREYIENMGFRIISYIPDFAYLIGGNREDLYKLSYSSRIYWVGDYHPYYKISPSISDNFKGVFSATLAYTSTTKETFLRIFNNYKVLGFGSNPFTHEISMVIDGDYSDVCEIARMNDVYWIEPWVKMELMDEVSNEIVGGYWQANQPYDGPGSYVNSLGWDGSGVIVSITDTGLANGQVPVDHPDFQDRVSGGIDYTSSGTWADGHAHGTHVAGIVAANGYLGTGEQYPGTTYYVGMGVAPNATLFVQRIFDSQGYFAFSNDTYMFWLAQNAYDNGVYISQNSWGAAVNGDYNQDSAYYDQVVRDSSSRDAGEQPIIYVFAAGNEGPNQQTVGSPGTAKNVITVGATENYWQNPSSHGYQGDDTRVDNPEEMASFSSRGPTSDGRIKPDVVAPGVGILSTRGSQASDTLWGAYDQYYLWCDGTSQATPQVSGAAAVIVQWWESHFSQKPSPAMVKAMLINSAVDISGGTNGGGDPIPNYEEGWGRVFLPTLLDPQVNVIYHDQDILLKTGDVYSVSFTVQDTSKPLKITLAWTDAPGNPSTDPVLVNDLNLKVTAPDGTVYYGNGFANGWSSPDTAAGNTNIGASWDNNGDKFDDRNNVENVFIDSSNLQTGTYTVEVIAYNIPQDGVPSTPDVDQDFALVIYNAQTRTDLPDLTLSPSDISFSNSNPTEGDIVTITATVYNVGNNDSYNVNVSFYYDYIDSSHLIGTVNFGNIPQGGSASGSVDWNTDGLAGTHNIIVFADSTKNVEELDELNNTAQKQITVQGYNIYLGCANNESYGQAGNWISYDIVVENTGTLPDSYELSVVENSANWIYYLSDSNVNLNPGNSTIVKLNVYIPSNEVSGNYTIIKVMGVSHGDSSKVAEIYTKTTVGKTILLVDDDNGQNYESYFTQALNANGYDYDTWDVSGVGSPSYGDMSPYSVVIWTTGADWSTTLSSTDESNLMQYLDNGGRLYLSSQDYLWDISGGSDGTISNTFVNNYLGVSSVTNDASYTSVVGVSGDPIGDGLSLALNYSYTNYADTITVGNGGVAIFTYNNQPTAVRLDTGTYRTVFTAFSFEAVENANASEGATLMNRIITWLMSGGVGLPTSPNNLTASIVNNYVYLRWDPPSSDGGSPIMEYRIYRRVSGGSFVYVGSVQANQTFFNDTSISFNTVYEYYVTAVNGKGEGPPSDVVSVSTPTPEIHPILIFVVVLLCGTVILRKNL